MKSYIPFFNKFNLQKQPRLAEIALSELRLCTLAEKNKDPAQTAALAKSISVCGIIEPPVVRRVGSGWEVVCGAKRIRAAELAGLRSVRCVVAEMSDRQAAIAALSEDIQRREPDCFEAAEAFRRVMKRFGLTAGALAMLLGISAEEVGRKLRLLELEPRLLEKLTAAGLGEEHAEVLLKAPERDRSALLDAAITDGLSADRLEAKIAETRREEKRRQSYKRRAGALCDTRLFFNTIERAVKIVRLAGMNVETRRRSCGGYEEYVIRVPEKK